MPLIINIELKRGRKKESGILGERILVIRKRKGRDGEGQTRRNEETYFHGQLSVGLFEGVFVGVPRNAQDFVIVV